MGVTQDVCSVGEFQSFAAANDLVLAFFWAQWSKPCELLQEAVDEVISANSKLSCAKVHSSNRAAEVLGYRPMPKCTSL